MSGELDRRVAALKEAAELADGRLDANSVDRARAVVDKAGARAGLGLETTVVALAGPTGAGKSQLFNALTGSDLAAVGRRRPTTSVGQAAVWGDGADALLDWLEIQRRRSAEVRGRRAARRIPPPARFAQGGDGNRPQPGRPPPPPRRRQLAQ